MEHFYQSIEGWFNMEEQYLELLSKVPEGGLFVELGAWKGRSTAFLATEIYNQKRNVKLFVVDTFKGVHTGSQAPYYAPYAGENIEEQYYQNIAPISDKISMYTFKLPTSVALNVMPAFNKINVLFIDASHEYEDVKKDIQLGLKRVVKGGIIAGHDYEAWPGVKKAVNEFFTPDKVENDCWFKKL